MGYHGLGMQRWITTMKPKKFLKGKSKTDGGGGGNINKGNVADYYHLDDRKLDNLQKKKYPGEYKSKLRFQLTSENRVRNITLVLSVVVAVLALWLFVSYLNYKLHWF
ncbi:MAG: hypothetical protein ACK5M7_04405 [Draconibacterium sp.]